MTFGLFIALFVFAFTAAFGPAPDGPSDAGAVQTAAEAALAALFPGQSTRLEVRVVRTGGDLDEAGALQVRFASAQGVPRAHTQVKVLAGDDATGWREAGWALLYVAHYDSVALARADVRQHDPVSPGDVGFAWIETTRFPGQPLRPADLRALSASGTMFASRPLRQGRPLQAGDLRPPYAADTGAAVVVRYQRSHFTLHLPCKAREPGFVGDAIRVYSADTQNTYRVRLTGPGTAEWIETL